MCTYTGVSGIRTHAIWDNSPHTLYTGQSKWIYEVHSLYIKHPIINAKIHFHQQVSNVCVHYFKLVSLLSRCILPVTHFFWPQDVQKLIFITTWWKKQCNTATCDNTDTNAQTSSKHFCTLPLQLHQRLSYILSHKATSGREKMYNWWHKNSSVGTVISFYQ